MLTTAHLVSGAAIAVALKNPVLVAPVAYASHYLLDFIPHYAPHAIQSFKTDGLKKLPVLELLAKGSEPVLGVLLVAYLVSIAAGSLRFSIALGAFCAWLPDLQSFLIWKYKAKLPFPLGILEKKIHKSPLHYHLGIAEGLWAELAITLACLFYTYALLVANNTR